MSCPLSTPTMPIFTQFSLPIVFTIYSSIRIWRTVFSKCLSYTLNFERRNLPITILSYGIIGIICRLSESKSDLAFFSISRILNHCSSIGMIFRSASSSAGLFTSSIPVSQSSLLQHIYVFPFLTTVISSDSQIAHLLFSDNGFTFTMYQAWRFVIKVMLFKFDI